MAMVHLFLVSEHVPPERRVEYTLIFQLLSSQDQKLKNRNNLIVSTFKNVLNNDVGEIYMNLFQRPYVVKGRLILWEN